MAQRSHKRTNPGPATAPGFSRLPDILFILADDMGAWVLGAAGNSEVKTPVLDRLASEGSRFENFFCTAPVCSPARASILSGRMPSAHGVFDWIRGGNLDKEKLGDMASDPYYVNESKPIAYMDGIPCYTDLLKDEGYVLGLSGKWHLGDSIRPQHGFDSWFTIGRGGCHYYKADVIKDGTISFENRYITDVITDEAIDFLETHKDSEKPLYLSVHYTAPHDPWEEDEHPADLIELYRDCPFESAPECPPHPNQIPSAPTGQGERRKELLRGYYAAITGMDRGIGRVLEHIRENTLVIFLADNGMNMGHHGVWGKGNGTFPPNFYDTSVKVPLIVSWKGVLPEGQVVTKMHSEYDFFPSFEALLGREVSEGKAFRPGSSLWPALMGEDAEASEDDPVVVFDEYGANRMIRTLGEKLVIRYPFGPDEFYDLKNDPNEDHNLIHEEALKPRIAELRAQLNRWFVRHADPALDGSREAVTGMGQLHRGGIYSDGTPTYGVIPKPKKH